MLSGRGGTGRRAGLKIRFRKECRFDSDHPHHSFHLFARTRLMFFSVAVLAWIGLALVLFPIQLFVTAPYGRHVREGWGPRIPNRLGRFAMEIVSLALFATLFL